jgi:excisionase family DNA binding protein
MKVREASVYFSIGKNIFYEAIHSGEIRAYKPNGRDFLLKVSEIEAWIECKQFTIREMRNENDTKD